MMTNVWWNGGGEVGGDDKGDFKVETCQLFAEFHAGEEMTLTVKWEHQDISNGFHVFSNNWITL